MKSIQFKVRLKFSDNVKLEDLNQIAENLATAIKNEASNGAGITPDDADYHTEECEVDQILIQKSIKKKMF